MGPMRYALMEQQRTTLRSNLNGVAKLTQFSSQNLLLLLRLYFFRRFRVVDWLVGDVNGKDCVIVDDVIDTGERAVNTANALRYAGTLFTLSVLVSTITGIFWCILGARNIYMFATHGVFSRGALDRFAKSPIKEVIITDTIRLPEVNPCLTAITLNNRILSELVL